MEPERSSPYGQGGKQFADEGSNMAAGPESCSGQVSNDFLAKQRDTALNLAEEGTRQLELTSKEETSVLSPGNAAIMQTNDALDESLVATTSTTPRNTLAVKAISSSLKLKEDEVMPMEVDPSSVANTSSGGVESGLSHTNGDQDTMDDSAASSLTQNGQEQGLLSSPTMTTLSGGRGFTKVEVMENSTKVDMDESSTNIAYPVYVSTLQEAEEVLHRFENNTRTRFCVWRCPRDFGSCKIDMKGKRIYWHEFIIEDRITVKSNGIPFVMMGRKVYDCHHGTDRNVALKHKARLKRQENDVKKRNVTAPSKKIGCPARIVFCEIIYFPQYKLETDTKHYRTVIAKTIRQHFAEGKMDLENIERRIYLCLPSDKDHKGHPTGKLDTGLSQRVDPKVSNKISQLVSTGMRNEQEVLVCLDSYIARELFPGRAKPFHSNRRYYPSRGVIRLKIYNEYILKGLSLIDLEDIEEATRQWRSNNPEDKFHFRRFTGMDQSMLDGTTAIRIEDEHEDELRIRQKIAEEQLLFVHQTAFQRHLLKRYGNHTCFLDPVYRTVKYAIPFYFLIVKTNVDYQVVASFVVQNESRVSIKEALELLKSWNPDWKPKIVMVDNDSEEIASIEESFSDCKVLFSDFHRELAWNRWLSQSTHGMLPRKDAILIYLRKLARATSEEEFDKALAMLEESDVWKCNYGKTFRIWFENRWLSVKERWAWSFKVDITRTVLTTNNNIEWQNKEFNHEQLVGHENTHLSDLLKILIDTILPAKKDAYFEQNGQFANQSTKYAILPTFFHSRPHQLAEHIAECTISSYDIASDDIVVNSSAGGEFLVKSCDSDIEYNVHFGDKKNLPHCECWDWLQTMLPCKHFVAIMREFREWDWSKVPESYTSSPYMTLDDHVNPNLTGVPCGASQSDTPDGEESNMVTLGVGQVYEVSLQKAGGKSTASRCRDILNEINILSYSIHERNGVTSLLNSLEEALTSLKLSAVEDDLVVPDTAEADTKSVKSEHKNVNEKDRRPAGSPLKRGKRTNESGGKGMAAVSIASKSAKLDQPPSAGQTNIPCTGNDIIEEHMLEEMNNIDLLNIEYYRPLSTSGEGGMPVNAGGIQGVNTSGTPNCPIIFSATQTSEPQTDSTVYKTSDFSQVSEKKDEDVVLAYSSSPGSYSKHEESLASRNEMLTHESINLAQGFLREAFPNVKGLQNVARGAVQAFEPVSGDFIQILHDGNLHWVCTSNVSFGASKDPAAVFMYDSMNQGYIAKFIKQQLASFLCIQSAEMKVIMKSVQQQTNTVDCGVFAIAFATALAFGEDPSKQRFDVAKMRPHLVECLKSKTMSPFPELKVGAGDIVLSKRKFYTIELFCSCRMPYEKPKSEADLLTQCSSCKEWFHQRCEKIALEIFRASGMNFLCSSCLKRGVA